MGGDKLVRKHKEIKNVVDAHLKDEYKNLESFMDDIPERYFVIKHKIAEPEPEKKKGKKSRGKFMYLIHKPRETTEHMNEVCAIFMEHEGKIKKMDQNIMREEIAKILIDNFTAEEFLKDFTNSLDPMQVMEAYERAVVKKGKVREVEDCYGWDLFGKKGESFRLQIID